MKQSFVKLNPRVMFRNPIMFIVEVVTFVMLFVTIWAVATGDTTQGSFGYNMLVFIVLFATLLFANFAEAIAEARGKAQADSLRKTREETPARLCVGNKIETVSSSQLKKGDIFICEAGDTIPSDGEIIEGLASIDESAITGESAPVIREAGGDKSSVTGGTKVLSDQIRVKVTTEPGESFLDKMIALVEGASRQKTPNEIALTILLAGFTLVFVVVCGTLKPFADYSNTTITIAAFISLFVCLIPTTIGGLLSAIGIAGMDRALSANVITKSGKAVETAGDIDTLLLDKTGTITIGNRKATQFYPVSGIDEHSFVQACLLSSLSDDTPEGKSIVELGREKGVRVHDLNTSGSKMIKFTAETKCSGVDLANGTRIRKGAFEAIRKMSEAAGNKYPKEVADLVQKITSNGGTPLVVSQDDFIIGVIELQDIIKPGIQERFERLRKMGVKTVMVTGDNPLTAKYIAEKAGVDDYIAEAKPEDKMNYIRKEQENGKLVAMMGDGTNDAPALNFANVGLSMGSGTSVAKDASDITLLDDSFASIAAAVMWGRSLYRNIQRFVLFQLTINFAAIIVVFVGSIFGTEMPLTVVQILWVNIIMDTFAALAMASLPPNPAVMNEPPRPKDEFIITPAMARTIFTCGTIFVGVLLGMLFYWRATTGAPNLEQLTVFFSVFVFLQFWNMFNAKGFEACHSVLHDLRGSRTFFLVLLLIAVGQVLIVEFGGPVFRTTPLTWVQWLEVIGYTSLIAILGDVVRSIRRRIRPRPGCR